ncbi:unnamed protein product [Symbiodinium necroappetens]|uniref:Uncharacterized protein n=1 Tax=Symbiodinium necroappetens TaxID=1628268 RepID=A0A812XE88_9DINO|nr:unnamed protein product [Symbiodinium necroappetens]
MEGRTKGRNLPAASLAMLEVPAVEPSEVLMPKAWLQPLVATLFDASGEHASHAVQFLFPPKEILLLQLPGPGRVVKTCFDAHMQAELDPRDGASRMAAEAEQADHKSIDPDAIAREEQHLPKEAIPSRQDCPEIHCEKCAECPSCPTCPSCPHGFRQPEGDEGTPPPVAGKVVCNRMENNCPFCPACQCPECPKKCQPCLKRVPNDPPTVRLDANGQVKAADGSPVNPLVQAINDDVKEHA